MSLTIGPGTKIGALLKAYPYEDASWLASGQVVEEVSADRMLERGEHPIRRIRESVAALEPGQALLLHSSFRPEPLMETMRRAGVAVHCVAEGPVYVTYFGHKRAVT